MKLLFLKGYLRIRAEAAFVFTASIGWMLAIVINPFGIAFGFLAPGEFYNAGGQGKSVSSLPGRHCRPDEFFVPLAGNNSAVLGEAPSAFDTQPLSMWIAA